MTCAQAAIIAPGAEKNASYPSIELDREELKRQNDAYSLDRLNLGEIVLDSCDPATLTLRVQVEVDYLFETPGLWKRWTEGADPIEPRKNELREALGKSLARRWTARGICDAYRDGSLKSAISRAIEQLPKLDETEETQTVYAVQVPSICVIDPATAKELSFGEIEKQPLGWGAPIASAAESIGLTGSTASASVMAKVQEKSVKKTDGKKAATAKPGKGKKPSSTAAGRAPKSVKPLKVGKPAGKGRKKK